MGFNRRFLDKEKCFHFLQTSSLLQLYGKSDMLIFEDTESEDIYEMFKQGKTDKEIAEHYGIQRVEPNNYG
jgi:DNA-binding NarL/FixJ family response regulator